MINIKNKIILILLFVLISAEGKTEIQDSLYATVGNKAITKSDIIEEIKIILILTGQEFTEDKRQQLEKTAIQSVIKRNIKILEIEKYKASDFNQQDFNVEMQKLASKLNLDIDTLKILFETNEINFEKIESRLKTELIWNSLIFSLYKDRLSIDFDEIEDQLKLIQNKKEIQEYLISEIIIQPVAADQVGIKINEIKNKIKVEGFNNVAKEISISETSINGGDLGWIGENVISNQFRKIITNTPIGGVSEPIFLTEGILIFKVRDKRKLDKIKDFEQAKKELIYAEKTKILNMHSLSHFDSLRRSISINYYDE